MTAKEFLNQYLNCEHEIQHKQEKARQIRDMGESITQSFSPAPARSGPSDKVGIAAGRLADMAAEIEADTQRLFRIMQDVEAVIELLPQKEKEVLRLRYINGLKWEQIAEKLKYTDRNVYLLHKAALDRIKIIT